MKLVIPNAQVLLCRGEGGGRRQVGGGCRHWRYHGDKS